MARTVGLVFNEPILEPEAFDVPAAEPQVPEEDKPQVPEEDKPQVPEEASKKGSKKKEA